MKYKFVGDTVIVEGDYTKHKRSISQAQYRLLAAFLGVLVIATFYYWFYIQVALASDAFIPR